MTDIRKKRSKFVIIKFFVEKYPTTTFFLLLSFFIEGILEGIGIISLLTLINFSFGQTINDSTILNEKIIEFLDYFSISLNLTSILIFITSLILMKSIISYIAIRYITYVTANFTKEFRSDLTKNVINANWNFLLSKHSGTYLSLINNNAPHAASIFIHLNKLAAGFIRTIIFLFLACFISYYATIFGLFTGIIIFFLLKFIINFADKNSSRINKRLKLLNVRLSDNFKGIKLLKSMGKENFLIKQFLNDYFILRKAERSTMLAKHGLMIIREPIVVVFLTLLIYFFITYVQLEFSKVLVISILFYRTLTSLGQIQAEYLSITISQNYFWSIFDIIKESHKSKEKSSNKKIFKKFNTLQLKNITFSFGKSVIFKKANLNIKKNNLILFHGKSGIGKTTLLDIIVGFYQPNEGNVLLNKVDLANYDIKTFRNKIGYVSQDQFIYNNSILKNISLDKKISKRDLEKALNDSVCHDFIKKLPKEINTIIGERGVSLSGGQKQRLSIARALLQNPDLLILDEPTVGLDNKNKEIILKKVKKLSRNMTVIIVSHDNYVFKYADFIYKINSQKLIKS